MTARVALIDYGAGNIASVQRGLMRAGADVMIARTASDVCGADGLVIPGVGHFSRTAAIDRRLRDAIATFAVTRPVLGVCVGLQVLFDGSDEAPDMRGLGLLPGRCFRLPPMHKVPHVGWNTVERVRPARILEGITDGTAFYFTHSFAAPVNDACVARTCHGADFASVVERGTVAAVQFHPEKSGAAGLRVLENFLSRC